jgi:hypothetical protein
MFEQFSSGYYLGRLYVEPYDGDRAAIHRAHHEQVNETLYDAEDRPLVMKVGSTHLAVGGAEDIPGRTLALPERALSAAGVDNPPTLREVFLAKADRARQLLEFSDAPPGADADGDGPAGF